MITLTREEREKFAAYLQQEALIEDGLAKQMGDMSGAKHYRMKAATKMLVARDLLDIKEMSIGG